MGKNEGMDTGGHFTSSKIEYDARLACIFNAFSDSKFYLKNAPKIYKEIDIVRIMVW